MNGRQASLLFLTWWRAKELSDAWVLLHYWVFACQVHIRVHVHVTHEYTPICLSKADSEEWTNMHSHSLILPHLSLSTPSLICLSFSLNIHIRGMSSQPYLEFAISWVKNFAKIPLRVFLANNEWGVATATTRLFSHSYMVLSHCEPRNQ